MIMIEIKKFFTDNEKLANIAFSIRSKVFVKEQHVNPKLEHDKFESTSHHYLLYYNKKPIATARWRKTNKGIKLERFAVLIEFRNKGIGTILLKNILKDVLPLSKTIYLHSQIKSVSFYERQGFKKTGDIFMEANIKHCKMNLDKSLYIVSVSKLAKTN